eukprot:4197182-Amphidinium_carterae.1
MARVHSRELDCSLGPEQKPGPAMGSHQGIAGPTGGNCMGTRGVPIGTGSPGTATWAPCGSASTLAEEPGPCRKRASKAAGTFQQT